MSSDRRAILEVQWVEPPPPARRAVLEAGCVLRVGRTELSDFRVPNDRWMSGVHFELSWDGARCRLRDRQSHEGTWLNGEKVGEADVASGAWIRAGQTLFMVFFEGTAQRSLPMDSPEVGDAKARALAGLRAEPAPLFALLDAARDARVRELLRTSVEPHQSLYDGVLGSALADVAPYLVRLPKESALLEALVREGWGRSWGVYLTSEKPFEQVRRHFRRMLKVEIEAEAGRTQRVYFRFYDPRVLGDFLPLCNARQWEEMFDGIGAFVMDGEGGEVVRFERASSRSHTAQSAEVLR